MKTLKMLHVYRIKDTQKKTITGGKAKMADKAMNAITQYISS